MPEGLRRLIGPRTGRFSAAWDFLSRYLVFRPMDVDTLFRYGRLVEEKAASDLERGQALAIYEKRYDLTIRGPTSGVAWWMPRC